jgi:hypothetical protein
VGKSAEGAMKAVYLKKMGDFVFVRIGIGIGSRLGWKEKRCLELLVGILS